MKNKILLLAASLFFLPSYASALLIGVSGGISSDGVLPTVLGSAPGDVRDDAATNLGLEGFDEKQNLFLASAINVDGGSIAAGNVIDSHMIFLNSEGGNFVSALATFEFDAEILGVMSDSGGTLEAATSDLLGAMGTIYPNTGFAARGLENNDSYSFIPGSNFLTVNFRVTEPGDWIRVITKSDVPEPSTVALLGLAAFGLVGLRRRQSA